MMSDEWTVDGNRITDDDVLSRLRETIESESALIVEHRVYRGSRSPSRFICNEFESLERYLRENTQPGDSFYIWRFEDCCRDDNVAEAGKVPDSEGRIPRTGAY
jgi:hypothetical protein